MRIIVRWPERQHPLMAMAAMTWQWLLRARSRSNCLNVSFPLQKFVEYFSLWLHGSLVDRLWAKVNRPDSKFVTQRHHENHLKRQSTKMNDQRWNKKLKFSEFLTNQISPFSKLNQLKWIIFSWINICRARCCEATPTKAACLGWSKVNSTGRLSSFYWADAHRRLSLTWVHIPLVFG